MACGLSAWPAQPVKAQALVTVSCVPWSARLIHRMSYFKCALVASAEALRPQITLVWPFSVRRMSLSQTLNPVTRSSIGVLLPPLISTATVVGLG